MKLRLFLILSFILVALHHAEAASQKHTSARLISAVEGVGQEASIQVGVEIKMEDGWNTYWRTPGEAGLAPAFDWAGSENLKSADIHWPVPTRVTIMDIENYDYKDKVTFPIDAELKEKGKPLSLNLRLDLLVCNKICLPESHTLSLTVPAKAAIVSKDHATLAQAVKKLPDTAKTDTFIIREAWLNEGDDQRPMLHVTALSDIAFGRKTDMFVEATPFVSTLKPAVSYDANSRKLHLQAPVRSADNLDALRKKMSVAPLTVTVTDGSQAFERKVTLSNKNLSATRPVDPVLCNTEVPIDMTIFLIALLGGLILNLMPCVLPVLSLKILSVLSHGGKDHRIHRWSVFRNFMAAAAGIVFSFWLIAAGLSILRATGHAVGWGIQFQHPGFLIFLIIVVTGFAANMWGLFEVPLPRFIAKHLSAKHEHEPTLTGHFLTGAFATLLATPCTAPFLGTAVSFALACEDAGIFIIFTFLGLGMALPYIVLALSPRVFKYMPKPGKWMVTLKKFLAIILALTAAWLINVLVTISTQPTLDEGWMEFSEALIKPAVEEGKTVIVDVTADWCLTCKANKRLVLEQDDVIDAISGPNILRLQADWTQKSETIAAYLRKYGKYGIPFNIVYGPGAPNGIILPELLSKKDIMRALEVAADE